MKHDKGLKSIFLRAAIPLIASYLTIMIAWSTLVPWFSARRIGLQWARLNLVASEKAFEELDEESDDKIRFLVRDVLAGNPLEPKARDGLALVSPDGKSAAWLGRIPRQPDAVLGVRTKDYYAFDHEIILANLREVKGHPKVGKLILVEYLDDSFAQEVAQPTGVEATIFAGTDPVGTTWRDISQKRIMPVLDRETAERLRRIEELGSFAALGTYEVPHYRGISFPEPPSYHVGQSSFKVFQSFFPIRNSSHHVVGAFALSIPEDMLMAGVKQGMAGSVILLLLFTGATIYVTIRLANRVVDPLTSVTDEVNHLSQMISKRYESLWPAPGATPVAGAHANEIRSLRNSVGNLKRQLDVAEQVSARIEEERARSICAAKMAALGEMATGIVHEINSPLTVITCKVNELMDAVDRGAVAPEEIRARVRQVEDTAMRVSAIVSGMQLFGRDGAPGQLEEVTVSELVAEIAGLYESGLKKQGIELRVAAAGPGTYLRCSRVQIAQVLLNLFNNARYAVAGMEVRWISIDAKRDGDRVKISVTDSGLGIPAALRDKIMEPFFTTKPVGQGIGLGLSISQRIIENHRGHLTIDPSCPNTRFVIDLPVLKNAESNISQTIS